MKRRATLTRLDFFTNLCTMAKLHLDSERDPTSDRAVLLKFYDHFGKTRNDGVWIEDSDYQDITLRDFPRKPQKRARKRKRVIIDRMIFGKVTKLAPRPTINTGERDFGPVASGGAGTDADKSPDIDS